MKTLQIKYILNENNANDESFFEAISIPDNIKQFILKYGGSKVAQNCFTSNNSYYIVSLILPIKKCNNPSIELILPAVQDESEGINRKDLIPFAIDPGGNPFYVSIGGEDYGAVYIDTITSRGYEEPILKIADSFEEFIDGLQPESEVS